MASLYKAFLSESESDTEVSGKNAKSRSKPKPKKENPAVALARSRNPDTKRNNSAPKAVTVNKSANPRSNAKNNADRNPVDRDERRVRGGRGRGGRGRGRGPRPGDRDQRGKRYFDRQSGTGRGREAKKGGAGGHNWGEQIDSKYNTNVSISMDQDAKPEDENKPKVEGEEVEKVDGEVKEGAEVEEEPKEPEKETFTFEEFLAKKAGKRGGSGFEDLGEAEVGEVEGRAYAKKDKSNFEQEDVFISFGQAKSDLKGKKKHQGRVKDRKMVEDIGFRVREPERERGYRGRGRRGGPRGGRGYRGGRGPRQKVDVDTNDQLNFPSLGA